MGQRSCKTSDKESKYEKPTGKRRKIRPDMNRISVLEMVTCGFLPGFSLNYDYYFTYYCAFACIIYHSTLVDVRGQCHEDYHLNLSRLQESKTGHEAYAERCFTH